jgi:hypothetical protein
MSNEIQKMKVETVRGRLHLRFGCAFLCRMRFQCHFQCQKPKNGVENACDGETHIQNAHLKRKCNRPLKKIAQLIKSAIKLNCPRLREFREM